MTEQVSITRRAGTSTAADDPSGTDPGLRLEQRRTDPIDRMLVELGMVSRADLSAATRAAGPLDLTARAVLAAEGIISQDELAEAVVAATGHLRGTLVDIAPEDDLLERFDEGWSRANDALPVRLERRRLVVAVAEPLPRVTEESLVLLCDDIDSVHQIVVTSADLDLARQRAYRDFYLYETLYRSADEELDPIDGTEPLQASRRVRLLASPCLGAAVAAVAIMLFLPLTGLALVLPALAGIALVLVAAVLVARPAGRRDAGRARDLPSEAGLPTCTVLAFAGEDLAAAGRTLASLRALDYPAALLDVRLLCREDAPIAGSLAGLALPPQIRVTLVPAVGRDAVAVAHNFGLALARGEHTVAFGPGRLPSTEQLCRGLRTATGPRAGRTASLRRVGGWRLPMA